MNTLTATAPLTTQALYEQVAERLRLQIFQRELAPGSWIDEVKLAQAFGISRTPLREALKVLASEGLITMKVRRGAYVTEVSEQDLAEVYHLLALLEADAAAAVAEHASDTEHRELQALHQQLEQAAQGQQAARERFFQINEQFHLRLLEVARNRWRVQMVTDLRKVMKLNRHHSLLKTGRIQESLTEHAAIMDAITQRQPEAAAQRMREHFRNGLVAAG